jgi:hypothetical protein
MQFQIYYKPANEKRRRRLMLIEFFHFVSKIYRFVDAGYYFADSPIFFVIYEIFCIYLWGTNNY